jgi:uncharacterized 2Fe-2S/4Fe-4S cluster protein (DUF4445 family)
MLIKFHNHEMKLSGIGENLGSVLLAAGIPIDLRCSGKGICDRCKVKLLKGKFSIDDQKISIQDKPLKAKACQTIVLSEDAVIDIPRKSLAGTNPKCAETFNLGKFKLSSKYSGLAAVIDVGTTTIAIVIGNVLTGEIIGSASDYNKQFKYGDNVVSRISFSTDHEGNLELLRKALVEENINPMLKKICDEHKLNINDIKTFSIAGNTVMTHILWGLSPAGMGTIPFEPETKIFPELPASEFGISAAPDAIIKAVPAISGFIGGDITAGIIVSKMSEKQQCALLIDVGTNCETVLQRNKQFYACAAAAGPAFEGAGVDCGSRGEEGAIEKIRIHPDLTIECKVIGDVSPHGICGSGMIDFVAEAKEHGLLNDFGRFDLELLKKTNRYLKLEDNIIACKLTDNDDIYMSEKDIESILKAKAAIFAGIKSLTTLEGCSIEDFETVYLAGGFAGFINIENAIKIGMLPDIPVEKYKKIGNSSLAGAALNILNKDAEKQYIKLITGVNDIILNTVPEFEMNYIDALMLP